MSRHPISNTQTTKGVFSFVIKLERLLNKKKKNSYFENWAQQVLDKKNKKKSEFLLKLQFLF